MQLLDDPLHLGEVDPSTIFKIVAESRAQRNRHTSIFQQGRRAFKRPPSFLVSHITPVTFLTTATSATLRERTQESDMAKNHYTAKPKRRNRSGKRKDTRRIAANMAKIRQLEGS